MLTLSCLNVIYCFPEPPVFLEKPEGMSVVKVRERKVFECRVVGTPQISVRWFRDGTEIHQSVKHSMSFVNSLASLEITGANNSDSGKYFCEAYNEAGSESCIVELAVKGRSASILLRYLFTVTFHIHQFIIRI